MDKLVTRNIVALLLLAIGVFSPALLHADEQDFASDFSFGVKHDLTKRLGIDAAFGARFANNSQNLDRLSVEGGISANAIPKWLDLEVGYVYIADWNCHDDYFSHRHRYSLGVDLGHKLTKRLSTDLRCKWQSTYKKQDGKSFKWDPKDYLRIRLGFDYKIKKLPLYPHVSAEAFWTTNCPDGDHLENMRYVAGVKYKVTKRNTIDLGFQYDDEMNVANPKDRGMVFLGYKFKF